MEISKVTGFLTVQAGWAKTSYSFPSSYKQKEQDTKQCKIQMSKNKWIMVERKEQLGDEAQISKERGQEDSERREAVLDFL